MVNDRRRLLAAGAVLPLFPLAAREARAQAYPAKPVRILVGFPPGGGADILTRLIAAWLQARLGQSFLVENRPGAGTNLATETVARAAPDGHTLLATTTSNLLNGALYDDLKYDFIRDFVPVAALSVQPLVLVAGPGLSVRSVPQFVAHARANPGKVTVGNFGQGTISHLAAEAFRQAAGLDLLAVPYRGSVPMVTELIGGRIQVAFDNIPGAIEHVRAGRLQALAVTSASRADALPGVPALAEFLTGYAAYAAAGIAAPRGTPPEVVALLNREVNAGLVDAKLGARLAELGATVRPGPPEAFAAFIARETERWGRVIRTAGIRPG